MYARILSLHREKIQQLWKENERKTYHGVVQRVLKSLCDEE